MAKVVKKNLQRKTLETGKVRSGRSIRRNLSSFYFKFFISKTTRYIVFGEGFTVSCEFSSEEVEQR